MRPREKGIVLGSPFFKADEPVHDALSQVQERINYAGQRRACDVARRQKNPQALVRLGRHALLAQTLVFRLPVQIFVHQRPHDTSNKDRRRG